MAPWGTIRAKWFPPLQKNFPVEPVYSSRKRVLRYAARRGLERFTQTVPKRTPADLWGAPAKKKGEGGAVQRELVFEENYEPCTFGGLSLEKNFRFTCCCTRCQPRWTATVRSALKESPILHYENRPWIAPPFCSNRAILLVNKSIWQMSMTQSNGERLGCGEVRRSLLKPARPEKTARCAPRRDISQKKGVLFNKKRSQIPPENPRTTAGTVYSRNLFRNGRSVQRS